MNNYRIIFVSMIYLVSIVVIEILLFFIEPDFLRSSTSILLYSSLAVIFLKYIHPIESKKIQKKHSEYFVMFLTISVIYYYIFHWSGFFEHSIRQEYDISNFAYYYLLFPISLLFPAIIEELFFRGFLWDKISNTSPVIKILMISTIFSLFHFPSKIHEALFLFVSSLFLSMIHLKMKDIKFVIGIHFLSNLIGLFYGIHGNENLANYSFILFHDVETTFLGLPITMIYILLIEGTMVILTHIHYKNYNSLPRQSATVLKSS
ncbi:CPBP family intramembrane glutamic endopeptidase [Mongoliitalea daihaiensis]|uniref:CPBP family intramembrane glutamic endopeptidase n=1 Tax=Mongoliitalea daihaiensis TaxID=2782006 RepID=UPI001F18B498|nr:CPBP family intramembrane glutamic endopeptidase [Mongoliitalea daihaiensis]UJP66766.1 CPBP family intramembrane metalloprotease [Mongoliitalea daihaiensis]